uniref:Uncharacterized protein n=1 Tax=Anguilla anguilla TaxID=7936 RepID=A0A0E9U965_ANGAN
MEGQKERRSGPSGQCIYDTIIGILFYRIFGSSLKCLYNNDTGLKTGRSTDWNIKITSIMWQRTVNFTR